MIKDYIWNGVGFASCITGFATTTSVWFKTGFILINEILFVFQSVFVFLKWIFNCFRKFIWGWCNLMDIEWKGKDSLKNVNSQTGEKIKDWDKINVKEEINNWEDDICKTNTLHTVLIDW